MPALLAHAKRHNVRLVLWVEWAALNRELDEALALYEKWGVAGIKIDGQNRDDQEMVRFTANWVRRAAEHHLTGRPARRLQGNRPPAHLPQPGGDRGRHGHGV